MSDLQKQYAAWDEFLSVWPASRLATMTLNEYSLAGSKDSFTYWIESRLDELGSIWGGSSFKFGVFSRKDTEDKKSDAKLSYSDTHGWYSSLGTTAEVAFEQVRGFVVQVADWAAKGDLEAIESFEHLGEAFKWKIAFHYQNRHEPVIVDIFKRAPLAVFVNGTASQSMATLQIATLAKRPDGLAILEFGRQVWEAWSQKNLSIWKLSHGLNDFSSEERKGYLQAELGVMHGDTAKSQGENFQEAPVGDLFFLCHGNESMPLVGQFTSMPEPCDKGDGWLQRRYRVLKQSIKQGGYQGGQKGWTPNYRSTFKKVPEHDLPELEISLLKPFFDTDLAELAALAGEPVEDVSAHSNARHLAPPATTQSAMTQPTSSCFNRIYYGPPGTGKTYTLMQLLKDNYEQPVQNTDEWQKQFILDRFSGFKWWEVLAAALYDLGRDAAAAKVNDLVNHPFVKIYSSTRQSTAYLSQSIWRILQNYTVEDSKTVKLKSRLSPGIFDKTPDSQWKFSGDWKNDCAHIIELVDEYKKGAQSTGAVKRYSFVTFHQSYGYEEFVEGLRPVLTGDADESAVQYEIRSGVFKDLCRRARLEPEQRFAMVIDEINRGNISRIFGELITLIETDKREGNTNAVTVTLPYSIEPFSIPANVDIIGTMNTADRSLALLDTALRRRFEFVSIHPDTGDESGAPLAGLRITINDEVIDIPKMLTVINRRIESLYDRDHCIGHAYFTGLKLIPDGQPRLNALKDIFRNRIIPLLEEYFFEDWQKIRLVLADNQKPLSAQFIAESSDHEGDLIELFGHDHGLDTFSTKRGFQKQDDALGNPSAYIGIYQTMAA